MLSSFVTLTDHFFLARRSLRKNLEIHAASMHGAVLDVGCGTKPYRDLFDVQTYIGMEVTHASRSGSSRDPDIYFDGAHFPLLDASVDSVLCSQTLEHVFEPASFLLEIRRVLKPKGRLLITVPFVWDEHEQPFDYGRYTSYGLKHLLAKAGFRQLVHQRTLANGAALVQLWLASLEKTIRPWPRALRAIARLAVVLPCNLLGIMIDRLSGNGADLYLDNVALFERTDA